VTDQTQERQDLHQAIDSLSDEAIGKLAHYMRFLRYEADMAKREGTGAGKHE
jgi:cytochrome c553